MKNKNKWILDDAVGIIMDNTGNDLQDSDLYFVLAEFIEENCKQKDFENFLNKYLENN